MFVREYPVDQLTPIGAYAAVAQNGSCLLETADNQAANRRHSFIGIEPIATFRAKGSKVELTGFSGEALSSDPYEALKALEKRFAVPAVGIVAYGALLYKEGIVTRHRDTFNLPDFFFQFYKSSLLFDHERNVMILSAPNEEEGKSLIERLIRDSQKLPILNEKKEIKIESDLSDDSFVALVERAKQSILAGDLFQIVLSRTFKVDLEATPLQIYRALRQNSPAPYLFLFECGDFAIAGASPEKLISVENGQVESMPIAGTCARKDSIEKLLADPKEIAEHVMLVDLARNDLGAVCLPGTLKVEAFKAPHSFSHTTHIVSKVVGTLDPKLSALDAFQAAFPAGTVTGAPKVRAMEQIDAFEFSSRGIYGGALLHLDGKGNLKSCIAIRMAFIKDGVVSVRAGAGIVLDSDPEKEAQETLLKANTVLDALKLVGENS